MADNIEIDAVAELDFFLNKCHDIALQLIEFKDSYAGDTLALEAACQDEQYKTLCAKVSPIISECQNAIDIIANSLLPFIEKKRSFAVF